MVSTSPLALRFAKQYSFMHHVIAFTTTETVDTLPHYRMSGSRLGVFGCLIASPAKYSQVAKVVFHMGIKNTHASTPISNARLKIWVSSLTDQTSNPLLRTITPGTSTDSNDVGFSGASGFFASGISNRMFSKRGDLHGTVPAAPTSGSSQMMVLEFDIFDPDSEDFFVAWNKATMPDEYMKFHCAIEHTSGPAVGNVEITSFGYTVVQAPSAENNTCTYLSVLPGKQDGSILGTWDADAAVNDQIRGSFRFRYNAAEWDGITSAHIIAQWGNKSNANDVEIRFSRLDSDTRASGSSTVLVTDSYDPIATVSSGWFRSVDLAGQLVDGEDYVVEYRISGGGGGGGPSGTPLVHLEIVQQNCSQTTTYFETFANSTGAYVGFNGSTPQIIQTTGYWDPTWFQNYQNEDFRTDALFGAITHHSSISDTQQQLLLSSNLSADQGGPTGFGGSAASFTTLFAENIDTIQLSFPQWQYSEVAIQPEDNPRGLLGVRKLIFRYSGSWAGTTGSPTGTSDHGGHLGLKYSFTVPNREIPEIADVFELGAFDPEGCASTAAGLGDPGVLVITNGSTIPKKFDPVAGKIEDAGVPTPFEGEIPTSSVDNAGGISPANGLEPGVYRYRYTFRNCCTGKEGDPSVDTISVDASAASPAAEITLNFSNVRIPGDPQICEICVYRGTVGSTSNIVMAKVGCFNPDDTSTFVDTRSDDDLDFINDPLSLFNAPMPCVPVVIDFRNRLFGLGDIPQLSPAGTVSAQIGSDIITGDDDVEWDRCLEGKFIQLQGDCRAYEILRVLPPVEGVSPAIGRLKLTEEYEGDINRLGSLYTICGRPNRLYFSEPLQPECWPALNFIDVEPGDGDRLMGGASNFDRLVICKRNKTYVLTFRENPLTEVVVPARISSDVGCVGPRTFAQIESGTVWLADRGLALFDGRGVSHIPESVDINAIFVDPDNPRYIRRDPNGRVIDAVGAFYPKREQYLCLLPTVQTVRGANLMLVWDIKLRNITLLEFCQEFQSMVVAKDTDGNERVYLGDTNGFVWIWDVGDTDGAGVPNNTGTLRGTVTAAGVSEEGVSFLEDSTATFINGGLPEFGLLSGVVGLTPAWSEGDLGLAGVCLYTRAAGSAPDDPYVQRTIFASTNDTLYITPSWGSDTPSVGDEYLIAPISMDCVFKPRNYGTDDNLVRDWRQVVVHEVEEFSSNLRVEIRPDFSLIDDEEETVIDENGNVVRRTFDMSFSKGRQVRPVGRRVHAFESIRLSNFAPEEPIRIINHSLGKEARRTK